MRPLLPELLPADIKRTLRSPWLHPLNDLQAVDELLERVNPMWALGRIRARVIEVRSETPDTKTFVLKPNARWAGHVAGQHCLIEMEINGVRQRRAFSLSSADSRHCSFTVRRQPGDGVTARMHAQLRVGSVLTLSSARGGFVLPAQRPERLLMLGIGSGVTPLMAMLEQLHAEGYSGDIVFVHGSRTADDAIFAARLSALAARWPALKCLSHFSATHGHATFESIASRVPDYAQRHTLMCGPGGFMQCLIEGYAERGLSAQLQYERFGLPPRRATAPGEALEVRCGPSERLFEAGPRQSLLEAAEAGGLSPKYGCRIGICRSCQCRKKSGSVENLLTGARSDAPDELIQLCISAARSDLELDL